MQHQIENNTNQTNPTTGSQLGSNLARLVRGPAMALALVAVVGCVPDEAEYGSGQHGLLSSNGLTPEALAESLPGLRALADGPVTGAGLPAMVATPGGIDVLGYAIGCALEPGDAVEVEVDGAPLAFAGEAGVAPAWVDGALDAHGRRMVSACLLAHVNAFGVKVPISLRGDGTLASGLDERTRFVNYEATFYGDLFADTPAMYACAGDPTPDLAVSYGAHDLTLGDRLLRRCSDRIDAGAAETLCGFELVGACSDVCDAENDGSHGACWTGADRTGVRFAETVSAWTLVHDDPGAALTQAVYDAIYGD